MAQEPYTFTFGTYGLNFGVFPAN